MKHYKRIFSNDAQSVSLISKERPKRLKSKSNSKITGFCSKLVCHLKHRLNAMSWKTRKNKKCYYYIT